MRFYKKMQNRFAGSKFVRDSVRSQVDLSAFKEKPGPRIIVGIILIVISYIIGWPAVGALGFLSIYFKEPLLLLIGGPLIYGLSHVVFWIGIYFAGAKYSMIFMKWATRRLIEKVVGEQVVLSIKSEHNNGAPDNQTSSTAFGDEGG